MENLSGYIINFEAYQVVIKICHNQVLCIVYYMVPTMLSDPACPYVTQHDNFRTRPNFEILFSLVENL